MDNWTIIETMQRSFVVNDVTLTADVEIAVSQDDIDPADDFDFGNEAENAAYLAQFQSGELYMGVVCVRATWRALEGHDHLAGCHLRAGAREDVLAVVATYDMVAAAMADLKANVESVQVGAGGGHTTSDFDSELSRLEQTLDQFPYRLCEHDLAEIVEQLLFNSCLHDRLKERARTLNVAKGEM